MEPKKRIIGFKDDTLSKRLLELGILPGKTLEVVRSSLFRGAFYVKVGRHAFILRREEMETIITED